MILPLQKAKYIILKTVYQEGGIKVSDLLKMAKVSQKIGYIYLQELLKNQILKEQRIGRKTLRIIYPNLESEESRYLFSLLEKEKEQELLERNPDLRIPVENLKNYSEVSGITSVVIFGKAVTKKIEDNPTESLNVLVIAESKNMKKYALTFLKKDFANIKNPVSARIVSKEGFINIKQTNPTLLNNLLRNHVCVYNAPEFLKLLR